VQKRLEPRFVEFVPEELDEATLYISMTYGTASHLCCCGCGTKVVTPITPTDWSMRFDGDTVSLFPSIGNWDQPCRSHYVIERNRVIPHGLCSAEDIEASRAARSAAKARYYGTPKDPVARAAPAPPVRTSARSQRPVLPGWLKRWLGF
jgi:hypothetical protein